MPRFLIVGAEEKTGRDIRIDVEAASEAGAESQARDRGILVASVRPMVEIIQPERREAEHKNAQRTNRDIGCAGNVLSMVAFVGLVLMSVFVFIGGYGDWRFGGDPAAKISGASLMIVGCLMALLAAVIRLTSIVRSLRDSMRTAQK